MPASNVQSIVLDDDGKVTITGAFTDIDDYDVKLLHVWLAGTGAATEDGVGLAIDCLKEGQKGVSFESPTFTLTKVLGANNAPFGAGPATVSAIAVLFPKPSSAGVLAEVIQWSRTLTLSVAPAGDEDPVSLSLFTASRKTDQ